MPTRILNRAMVRQLLSVTDCIPLMRQALLQVQRGHAVQPLRTFVPVTERNDLLGSMPGALTSPATIGCKVLSIFPGNHAFGLESHQGAVLLFDADRGQLNAVIDAAELTELRTAAVSAVATEVLAKPDACVLALVGSGPQARSHLAAMTAIRPVREVRVTSRQWEHTQRFANTHQPDYEIPIVAVPTVAEAVAGADIICTLTAAREPIMTRSSIQPGTHINAVGACTPQQRELEGEILRDARVFVDRIESAHREAGDYLLAKEEGLIDDSHLVGELGAVLDDVIPGRHSPDEITIFLSQGIAIEDLAAAHFLWQRAEATDAGVVVDFP